VHAAAAGHVALAGEHEDTHDWLGAAACRQESASFDVDGGCELASALLDAKSKATQSQKIKSYPKSSNWPLGELLKINVDGSYIAETSCGGWGFVIGDADGAVCWGRGYSLWMDAFHSEVLA